MGLTKVRLSEEVKPALVVVSAGVSGKDAYAEL